MTLRTAFIAAGLLAAPAALAQTAALQNGSFEQSGCLSPTFPQGWHSPGDNANAKRRSVGDGLLPTISPIGTPAPALTPHSGTSVLEIKTNGTGGFWGVTTDSVNYWFCDPTNCFASCPGPYPFFDPVFDYNAGDVVVDAWYMIPANDPIVGDAASIKIEVKSGNYDVATQENYASDGTGGSIIGHTNGLWVHKIFTFSRVDIQNQYECNTGIQSGCGCLGCIPVNPRPTHVKISPSRFVGDGLPTSGTIYWDDITYTQLPVSHCGTADFNCDGDTGTDADIEAFFACLAGNCPAAPCTSSADFNGDGDIGTDADIEAFFRVLGGGSC